MIAITLVSGAAVIGFVNGQTGVSSQAVGNSAAANIDFLNEREVVVLATMTDTQTANVYVYNNGAINPETILKAIVYQTSDPTPVCTIDLDPTVSIATLVVSPIVVDLSKCAWAPSGSFSFASGTSYTFQVLGQFGSTAQITVKF